MQAIEKYRQASQQMHSKLCIGLDTDYNRLPDWCVATTEPLFTFNRWIIRQTHEYAAAYKLNTAFYEARGEDGWRDMRLTLEYLRTEHPQHFTICDAKRADIGNTNQGYVEAIFDRLGFDAITLHPYLGQEALMPFLERADRASIILCRTSNPQATELQALPIGNLRLWEHILTQVSTTWNTHGNCMAVIGATAPQDLQRAREIAPNLTFLVPGVGAQGGDAASVVQHGADADGGGLIVNVSRGVIFADNPAEAAQHYRDALNS